MSIRSTILSFIEKRFDINDILKHKTMSWLFGMDTKAGIELTYDKAIECSTVYACIRVLAESVASLPFMVYKKSADGKSKEVAIDHPLYPLLHDSPNDFQTAFEFRENQMGHLNMRGNSFAFIDWSKGNKIKRILPLNPDAMKVVLNGGGSLTYKYIDPQTKVEKEYPSEAIWHTRGMSFDGIMGVSPIRVARQAIGISLGAEDYSATFYRNNARPSGILKHPGTLKPDVAKQLKDDTQEALTGDNRHKMILFQGGVEWQSIGLTQADAQYLESRNFQVAEIARFYRVPLMLIGHNDTITYASAEQFMLMFVIHSLRPWLVRIEQSANKNLLTQKDRDNGYYTEHVLEGLLRGDTATRYEGYTKAISSRWMTRNEVRSLENLNPVDGGDEFENPNIDVKQPPGENDEPETDGEADIPD